MARALYVSTSIFLADKNEPVYSARGYALQTLDKRGVMGLEWLIFAGVVVVAVGGFLFWLVGRLFFSD